MTEKTSQDPLTYRLENRSASAAILGFWKWSITRRGEAIGSVTRLKSPLFDRIPPTMRNLFFFAAYVACSISFADDFHPEGSEDVFTVTQEILAETPKCDPLTGEMPVSAAAAIRVAAEYHNKTIPNGRTTWYVFELAGATLVRAEDDRWYWVVQYRGLFDPRLEPRADGKLAGGYSFTGPKRTHNRYPVLMNGKLAPHHPVRAELPTAIRPVSNETQGAKKRSGADLEN